MKTMTLVLTGILATSAGSAAFSATEQSNSAPGSAASADRQSASLHNSGSAQAAATSKHSEANMSGSSDMNATLTKSVDARKAKPGDPVKARADTDSQGSDGTTIKRGSTLVGHVTKAEPKSSTNGSAASELGIVFDKAILKDGREVPLNSRIDAISAAQTDSSIEEAGVGGAMSDGGYASTSSARGGLLGGAAGSASGMVGGAGRLGHGITGNAGGMLQSTASLGTRSAGAVGGLNAAGNLVSGSKGVFGLDDLRLSSAADGDANGSVVSSSMHNVRLDGGTKLLLTNAASMSGATGKPSQDATGSTGTTTPNEAPAKERGSDSKR